MLRPTRQAKNTALHILQGQYSESEPDDANDILAAVGAQEDDVVCHFPVSDEIYSDLAAFPNANGMNDDDMLDEEDVELISSGSDIDASIESEEETPHPCSSPLLSPSGVVWYEYPRKASTGRASSHNVFTGRPGIRVGLHPNNEKEAFLTLFDNIIDLCVRYTNLEGRRRLAAKQISWTQTSRDEMEAFFGMHMLSGAMKSHHRSLRDLYSERDGIPLFRATMSEERFIAIKSCLRFDDKLRRNPNDKLAPVRETVELFNAALAYVYEPNALLTIDEMLVEYHGRVGFKQYIPSKPGKFGIKIFWIVEAETSIPLKCLVYVGSNTLSASELEHASSMPEAVVYHLAQPWLNRGRNITLDNFFTSKALGDRLLKEKTTIVGTIRQNRREIPPKAKSTSGRVKGDTHYFYTDTSTLASFWDKKKSPVLLYSTMHDGPQQRESNKPEVVLFYNQTKSGVDTLDKLVRVYRSKRKCTRWLYGIVMTLADVAEIVAMKLMGQSNHYESKRALAYQLCDATLKKRAAVTCLRTTVKTALEAVGYKVSIQNSNIKPTSPSKNGRCVICPRTKDKRTRRKCSHCQKYVCPEHSFMMKYIVCPTCYENEQ